MDRERWLHIKSLFETAVEMDPGERGAYLDRVCHGDADLRERVQALLLADESELELLDESPDMLAAKVLDDTSIAIPEYIGPYRIIRFLGSGGMGSVYQAEHTDRGGQTVALKVLRGASGNGELLRRFQVEWQVLASLNHPNIARLYDRLNSFAGSPAIAMEFVKGAPINEYCDDRRFSIAERLRLFERVCAATHHAHENLVVHRDIKPANVLVTDDNIPKLLDFGIAKVLNPDLLDTTALLTRTGMRVLTPAYASPEQLRGDGVGPASDVYSLGVLLYELLTSRRPHRTTGLSSREIEKSVCEVDPIRPSERVVRLEEENSESVVEKADAVSTARGTNLPHLRRQLQGDIDRIVLKALHKDPARRYASAEALRQDIRRYLAGQPIKARPDRLAYRTRKFLYRHRVGFAFTLGIIGIVAAVASMVWRSDGLEPLTVGASGMQTSKMIVALPFRHEGATDRDYFAAGFSDALTAHLSGASGLRVIARASALNYRNTEKSLAVIGDELGVDYILDGTIQFETPTDPEGSIQVVPSLIRTSDNTSLWTKTYSSSTSDIFELQRTIAEEVADVLGVVLLANENRESSRKGGESLEAYNYYLRGNEFFRNDEDAVSLGLAETMYTQAIARDSTFSRAYAQLAKVHAAIWFHQIDRSDDRCTAAQEAAEKALVYDPVNAESYTALGMYAYRCRKNLAQALNYFERALKIDANAIDAIQGKAFVLRRQGKLTEALENFRQLTVFDPIEADYAAVALTLQLLRRYAEAETAYIDALDHFPEAAHLYAIIARMHLGWSGSFDKARQVLEDGMGGTLDNDFTRVTSILIDLGSRRYQDALNRVEAMRQDVFDTQVYYIPASHMKARALRGLGRLDEAYAADNRAREHLETFIESHPDDARAFSTLGRVYAGLGRMEEAIEAGQRGVELMPIHADAVHGPLRVEDLAAIYTMAGRHEPAIAALGELLANPGFASIALIEADETWDALRNHPKYSELAGMDSEETERSLPH